MKKLVWYCPYYGIEHLCLLRCGWQEETCRLFADDTIWVKMVTYG